MIDNTVVIPRGLAPYLIGKYADPNDWKYEDAFNAPVLEKFLAEYELVLEGAPYMGDPQEGWYQGVTFTSVIRRKSDGELFGYNWWEPISKHGEPYFEGNGDDFGLGYEDYVFLPVKPFTITGYEVLK